MSKRKLALLALGALGLGAVGYKAVFGSKNPDDVRAAANSPRATASPLGPIS